MKVLRIFILIDLALLIIFSQSKLIQANSNQPEAIITIQNLEQISEFFDKNSNTISKTIPFSLNLDGTGSIGEKLNYFWEYPEEKTYNSKNPRSHRFEKAGNYIISLKITDLNGNSDLANIYINALEKSTKSSTKSSKSFQNGDLSKQIFITEIFPNPKGKDQDKEWIELYNASNQDVNLGNWEIHQTNEQNKTTKMILSDDLVIKSKNFLVINSKTALRNSNNTITLADFQNKQISEIHYTKTKEDKSFSVVLIKNLQTNQNKKFWQWTEPTPQETNKIFYLIEGEILENKVINSTHEITLKAKDLINLNYTNKGPNPQILEIAFQQGNVIRALAKKENHLFQLLKFEIINQKNIEKNINKDYTNTILVIIITTAGLTLYLSKKLKANP